MISRPEKLRRLIAYFFSRRTAKRAATQTANISEQSPASTPPSAPRSTANPWSLGLLGGCSFNERAKGLRSLLHELGSRPQTPYLSATWALSHLKRWADEIIPTLSLGPGLENVCANAVRTISDEIIADVQKDRHKGKVIWVPDPEETAGKAGAGRPADESTTPYVCAPDVLNRFQRWCASVIPECPIINDTDKAACARVVMEIAWEMASSLKEEDARRYGAYFWVPDAEIDFSSGREGGGRDARDFDGSDPIGPGTGMQR